MISCLPSYLLTHSLTYILTHSLTSFLFYSLLFTFTFLSSATPIVELWNKIDCMEDPESVMMEAMYMPVGTYFTRSYTYWDACFDVEAVLSNCIVNKFQPDIFSSL